MTSEFRQDVLAGLRLPQKALSPKYFYDAIGAQYFDEICQLDEYYPYRTELNLLPQVAKALREEFTERGIRSVQLIEFGAGSLHKVKPLLRELQSVEQFVAIDISREHLQQASEELASAFPELPIKATQGDFTKPMTLDLTEATPMVFFPGSTIGNFEPQEARDFLQSARTTMGSDSFLLLGFDTKKDRTMLENAYNDSRNVTARFNKNILERINRELDGSFTVDTFEHLALYNEELGRIEMHLRSNIEQTVTVAGETFHFAAGETIHTENSYKYHPHEFEALLSPTGWQHERLWLAPDGIFAVMLLRSV